MPKEKETDQRIKIAIYQHSTDQIFIEHFPIANRFGAYNRAKFHSEIAFAGDKVLLQLEEGAVYLQ